MEIIKKVVVKQILTEDSRNKMKEQLLSRQYRLNNEIQQLEFVQQRQMRDTKADSSKQANIQEGFKREMTRRKERLRQIEVQLSQLDDLELGSEVKEGTLQTIENIEEGDDWQGVMGGTEIVIKDGVVHEIRKGGILDDE
ncbi:YlqD family protein [Texcoconibacillus texcoconensis]|uniref:YlqD protein n=1 Tax=Texcoconibacillus texcoconensis TaxID=1095777 RepID=A0A840QL59_9BACI|nr:YlqD family protein [Texcoconibacillus texcoconensis]MBB5172102.1 hypothetical protein [Texcoconibacillus texcoconensis]